MGDVPQRAEAGLMVRPDCDHNAGSSPTAAPVGLQGRSAPATGTRTISPCGGPRNQRERKARLELRVVMVDLVPPADRTRRRWTITSGSSRSALGSRA